MDIPKTRAEARALGLKHYFTGKPCSRGHITTRHITGTCVDCQQIANKEWAARNPGEGTRRAREWTRRNPDKARTNALRSWRRKAGIPAAARPMPERCENQYCGKPLNGRAHLDHDHKTKKFRGWLCAGCNLGLGCLGDSIESLESALTYLRKAL